MKLSTWSVPPMWAGRTVAVLASGPSMSQSVADRIHGEGLPAIVINTTYKLAPWADILYAADQQWWIENPDALHFRGLKVTCTEPISEEILRLSYTGPEGFEDNPSCLRTGNNSGYQAVHIAAHAKAARILLCGMNMGGENWHGRHPAPLRTTTAEEFSRWLRKWDTLAPILRDKGIEVWNCTPDSALQCFPYVDLETALQRE